VTVTVPCDDLGPYGVGEMMAQEVPDLGLPFLLLVTELEFHPATSGRS
jgi:hypothetical protein